MGPGPGSGSAPPSPFGSTNADSGVSEPHAATIADPNIPNIAIATSLRMIEEYRRIFEKAISGRRKETIEQLEDGGSRHHELEAREHEERSHR